MTSKEPRHRATPERKPPTSPYTSVTEGDDLTGIEDYIAFAAQRPTVDTPADATIERSRNSGRDVAAILTFAASVLIVAMIHQGHDQSSNQPAPVPQPSTPNQVSFQNPDTLLHR
ncbi:MAG TPA: hypothetical protein VGE34_00480 [Candidatus Saccharimonadales bacterium]